MAFGLDSSIIAQGVRPAAIENPIQSMEGVARVQQLARQAQLAPLQQQQLSNEVQSSQLDLEAKRREANDQLIMQKALVASGGDLNKLVDGALKGGASPKTVIALQGSLTQRREQLAKADEAELKVDQARND